MTATLATAPARTHESPRRALSVTRLLYVNKTQILYIPLAVLGAVFLLNYAIWWLVIYTTGVNTPSNHDQLGYSGAVFYIYIYALITAVTTIARTFPFSLGFGVTRHDFYLGAAIGFVVLAAIFSSVLTILSIIEVATNGWGVGGRMFAPLYFSNSAWGLRFVMYFVLFLFCLSVGAASASVYVRWRAIGLVVFFGLLAVALVGGGAVISLLHDWPAFGKWIVDSGPLGIALWTLVPTAIAGLAGFFILRRATPKN